MPKLELRPYQAIAAKKIRDSWETHQNMIFQSSVGSGKSEVATGLLENIAQQGKKGMFVVHGRELVYQFSGRLTKYGINHGIFMASEQPSNHSIQVASIDTIKARYDIDHSLNYDYIFIDEAHEIGRYKDLWKMASRSRKLGLSATPARSGMRGLGKYFSEMIYGPPIHWLVNNNYLVEPQIFYPKSPDTSHLTINKMTNEYNPSEVDNLMADNQIVADSYAWWYRITGGTRKTIVFCGGVKHSKMMTDIFLRNGVASAHIDGTTPKDERKKIFRQLREGEILVIFNNRVLDRGFDEPSLEVLLDLQPVNDYRRYIQKIGRIMRTFEGKFMAQYIDMAGNFRRHGDPTDATRWPLYNEEVVDVNKKALEDLEKKERKGIIEVPCPSCSIVFNAQLGKCPNCGHKLESSYAKIKLEEIKLDLVQHIKGDPTPRKVKPTMAEKLSWYRQLLHYAKISEYSKDWASKQYKAKFGTWPRSFTVNGKRVSKNAVKPDDFIRSDVREFILEQKKLYALKMAKKAEESR